MSAYLGGSWAVVAPASASPAQLDFTPPGPVRHIATCAQVGHMQLRDLQLVWRVFLALRPYPGHNQRRNASAKRATGNTATTQTPAIHVLHTHFVQQMRRDQSQCKDTGACPGRRSMTRRCGYHVRRRRPLHVLVPIMKIETPASHATSSLGTPLPVPCALRALGDLFLSAANAFRAQNRRLTPSC